MAIRRGRALSDAGPIGKQHRWCRVVLGRVARMGRFWIGPVQSAAILCLGRLGGTSIGHMPLPFPPGRCRNINKKRVIQKCGTNVAAGSTRRKSDKSRPAFVLRGGRGFSMRLVQRGHFEFVNPTEKNIVSPEWSSTPSLSVDTHAVPSSAIASPSTLSKI